MFWAVFAKRNSRAGAWSAIYLMMSRSLAKLCSLQPQADFSEVLVSSTGPKSSAWVYVFANAQSISHSSEARRCVCVAQPAHHLFRRRSGLTCVGSMGALPICKWQPDGVSRWFSIENRSKNPRWTSWMININSKQLEYFVKQRLR